MPTVAVLRSADLTAVAAKVPQNVLTLEATAYRKHARVSFRCFLLLLCLICCCGSRA